MSYGVRQLTQGAFSPVKNVGKLYKTTLKPEKGKINTIYVNLINGRYIYNAVFDRKGLVDTSSRLGKNAHTDYYPKLPTCLARLPFRGSGNARPS